MNGRGIQFTIVIVGGGVAGLVASILLRQSGNEVTVIERKSTPSDPGNAGGLSLNANANRIIAAIGLEDAYRNIIMSDRRISALRYESGELIGHLERQLPNAFFNRVDLLSILHAQAVQIGVVFRLGTSLSSLDFTGVQSSAVLSDGSRITADILIGADGVHSQVRQALYDVKVVLQDARTFLAYIPRSVMEQNPESSALYHRPNGQMFLGHGKNIICWTMHSRAVYHLQITDFAYDCRNYGIESENDQKLVEPFHNMEAFRRHWSDGAPEIKQVLAATETLTRWRTSEVPLEPKWSSISGNALLLGDAAHSIQPYAGQGAAMGIEDAAALSELLSLAQSKEDIGLVAQVYESVRKPRLEGIKRVVRANIEMFSLPDGPKQVRRDRAMADRTEWNGFKGYGQKTEVFQWIDNYDAASEARKAWFSMHPSKQTASL